MATTSSTANIPEMKPEYELTEQDFLRYPVWIGVHNYDYGQPWYDLADEQTFRPWTEPLPFAEKRGIALVKATFQLADGGTYPGFFSAVRHNWDEPIPGRKLKDGTYTKPLQWSARRTGGPLTILALQRPVMFIGDRLLDFHLKRPPRRKPYVKEFYAALGKPPESVFPVRFFADPSLSTAIIEGRMDGFFSFPLDKPHEIDTGKTLLLEPDDPPPPAPVADVIPPGVRQIERLTVGAFQEFPIWMRVPFRDPAKPAWQQAAFRPWMGPVPVDAGEPIDLFVSARFRLKDGSEYAGYVRPVTENWADFVPPPVVLGETTIQPKPLRQLHGDRGLNILEAQMPAMFVGEDTFHFWCGARFDPDEQLLRLRQVLGKNADAIFPVAFEAASGLAKGIVSGESNGFYEPTWMKGTPPRLVR